MQDALTEIDTLQAIFNDELVVDKSNTSSESPFVTVQRLVRPVEQNLTDSEPVSLLKSTASVIVFIRIDAKYPSSSPVVEVRQPRGLTDDDVKCLETQLSSHLQANVGVPIIFEIFQLTQEFLERCDVPRVLCSICLAEFSSEAAVVSTDCGHFFHRHCLGRYLRHCDEETKTYKAETPSHLHHTISSTPKCPVCRAELSGFDRNSLISVNEPEDTLPDSASEINLDQWRLKQQQLSEVYERQRANGGLIDLDEESKRNLITEDTRVAIPVIATVEEPTPSTSTNSEREKEPSHSAKQRRHWRGRNTHHVHKAKAKNTEDNRNFSVTHSNRGRAPKTPREGDGFTNANS